MLKSIFNAYKCHLFNCLHRELEQFLANKDNDKTINPRITSFYFFLYCHATYDDIITSLNRFINASKQPNAYTTAEAIMFRVFLFKLELPMLWLNRLFK